MRKTATLLVPAAMFFLSACAAPVVYKPEISRLAVREAPAQVKSVAIMNFRLGDTVKGEGPTLANYVAGALAREGYAASVERVDRFADDNRSASALAREAGAEVAVYGTIDEFAYGGLTTESSATVSLYAVDATTGDTLWRLSGTMSQPGRKPEEKFFYLDNGEPAPMPMKLSIAIVADMARVMTGKPVFSESQEPPKPKYSTAPRDQGNWKSH